MGLPAQLSAIGISANKCWVNWNFRFIFVHMLLVAVHRPIILCTAPYRSELDSYYFIALIYIESRTSLFSFVLLAVCCISSVKTTGQESSLGLLGLGLEIMAVLDTFLSESEFNPWLYAVVALGLVGLSEIVMHHV